MTTKKILVIDDDECIQDLLSLLLKGEGYSVTIAKDGQIGFEKAVTDDYDLIITDIIMPNWNGSESIYGLNLINSKIKIIVVSGKIEGNLKAELKTYENVIGIYPKPFDTKNLLTNIKIALV
jgi:DNA-binding response OmpR family regulator